MSRVNWIGFQKKHIWQKPWWLPITVLVYNPLSHCKLGTIIEFFLGYKSIKSMSNDTDPEKDPQIDNICPLPLPPSLSRWWKCPLWGVCVFFGMTHCTQFLQMLNQQIGDSTGQKIGWVRKLETQVFFCCVNNFLLIIDW